MGQSNRLKRDKKPTQARRYLEPQEPSIQQHLLISSFPRFSELTDVGVVSNGRFDIRLNPTGNDNIQNVCSGYK